MFLNSFFRSRLGYSCQNWNLTVGQFQKLDVTYQNLLRRMIGGFKCIGDNDGDFWYNLNIEKVHTICCASNVSNFIRKQQKDYAGNVCGVCVCVCLCVCLFISFHRGGFFRLQDVRDILEGADQRSYVVNINLGASAKFLHLGIWKCHISPPKTKTPARHKTGEKPI